MCKELKPIYQAVDADAAERALERFRNTTMGKKYPAIIQIWERAWAQVIPFFQFALRSVRRSIRSIRLKGSTELSGR
ncbi:MAG: transposase [Sutterella wadsworthensis]